MTTFRRTSEATGDIPYRDTWGPKRIQRKRTKGWRMPEGAVYVGRPTAYGNPFVPASDDRNRPRLSDRLRRVENFRAWLTGKPSRSPWFGRASDEARSKLLTVLPNLRGRDLACWCGLCDEHADGLSLGVRCGNCQPCHADVLLQRANRHACGCAEARLVVGCGCWCHQ